jgi:hypothetical protein
VCRRRPAHTQSPRKGEAVRRCALRAGGVTFGGETAAAAEMVKRPGSEHQQQSPTKGAFHQRRMPSTSARAQ